MLTSTCLALKTMPCAPSPMRPRMQYCSIALCQTPGPSAITAPPRHPYLSALARPASRAQRRLPSNGAGKRAEAGRPRAATGGVRACLRLPLGPRHHASVSFIRRKSSLRRPWQRERHPPPTPRSTAGRHVTSDARLRRGAGACSLGARRNSLGSGLPRREGGAALRGGGGALSEMGGAISWASGGTGRGRTAGGGTTAPGAWPKGDGAGSAPRAGQGTLAPIRRGASFYL